jgi:NADPH:quinone reductase-like Zn-dependent oxidoreductase
MSELSNLTTQAIWIDKTGPANSLVLRDTIVPPPGPEQVRIRIEAAGVAYADVMLRNGVYPGAAPPIVPGYDCVGIVEALGEGAEAFVSLGQRVVAVTVTGSYARHRNVEAHHCVAAPADLAAEVIVAGTMNGLTAWQMFHRLANPVQGETVLIHGAAGGVGTLLLDLAAHAGVAAIGTASAGKHDVVLARGGMPIDYKTYDFAVLAKEQSEGGVVAAFDHIGGKHFKRSLSTLRPGGIAITYGAYNTTKGGKTNPFEFVNLLTSSGLNALDLLSKSKSAAGYNVQGWRDCRPNAYRHDLPLVMQALESGIIKPEIGAVLPLEKAGEAHGLLESAQVAGKIVLRCA